VPSIYYGFQGRPRLVRLYWAMVRPQPSASPLTPRQISTIALATGYACVSPSFRQPAFRPLRAALFVAMGLSAILPVFHGLLVLGYAELRHRIALHWLASQGALYIFGAGLYAARVPECLWPGSFDLWASSHQIFHFFVLAAAAVHLTGVVKAFHAKHTGPHAADRVVTARRRKAE
jgi:adiponectin receptor